MAQHYKQTEKKLVEETNKKKLAKRFCTYRKKVIGYKDLINASKQNVKMTKLRLELITTGSVAEPVHLNIKF
jgi:hypothetical protein